MTGKKTNESFEDKVGADQEELWNKIKFWCSLWVSVTYEFRDYSFADILRDWKVAAD